MNLTHRYINNKQGKPEFIILPIAEYEALLANAIPYDDDNEEDWEEIPVEKDEFDPAEISDDESLFGEQSRIQLDSLDALQVVVALQAHFGVRLQGDRMVRKHMMNVRDLAAFIREQHSKI